MLRSDKKQFQKTRDVVMKSSLSRFIAIRLFQDSLWPSNDKVWKNVYMSE